MPPGSEYRPPANPNPVFLDRRLRFDVIKSPIWNCGEILEHVIAWSRTMSEPNIEPHRITKPIQLLAAWLAGLAIINSAFLVGAGSIKTPDWIPGLLSIAAVANVPAFLLSLFLLQTKFRPEMQEDSYYSKYLEKRTDVSQQGRIDIEKNIRVVAQRIVREIPRPEPANTEKVVQILKESEVSQLKSRFERSRSFSELYLAPEQWRDVVEKWKHDSVFHEDVAELKAAGLIEAPRRRIEAATLTEIGREVAKSLAAEGKLWNQTHRRKPPVDKDGETD